MEHINPERCSVAVDTLKISLLREGSYKRVRRTGSTQYTKGICSGQSVRCFQEIYSKISLQVAILDSKARYILCMSGNEQHECPIGE